MTCPKCKADAAPHGRYCWRCGEVIANTPRESARHEIPELISDSQEETLIDEVWVEPIRDVLPIPLVTCPVCGVQNEPRISKCWECGINLIWALEHITEPCPVCGKLNSGDTRYCWGCSADLVLEQDQEECRICGKDNPLSAIDCEQCGIRLTWVGKKKPRAKSAIPQPVTTATSDDIQTSRNTFAFASIGAALFALSGTVIAILMIVLGGLLEVNVDSPVIVLAIVIALISGVISLGGISCAIIALMREKYQASTTGRRYAIIGLALSGTPLMCCVCLIPLGFISP